MTARRNTTDRLLAKLREHEGLGYGLAAVQWYASAVLRDWYPHPRCVLMRFEVETLDLRANDLEAAARLPLVTAEVLAQAMAAAEAPVSGLSVRGFRRGLRGGRRRWRRWRGLGCRRRRLELPPLVLLGVALDATDDNLNVNEGVVLRRSARAMTAPVKIHGQRRGERRIGT